MSYPTATLQIGRTLYQKAVPLTTKLTIKGQFTQVFHEKSSKP